MRGLREKVAFVSGGAGGIGTAVAERLIEEGALVAVADLDEDRAIALAERLGAGTLGLGVDIGEEASIYRAIDAAYVHFGRIDILINNAALTSPAVMSLDTDVTDIPLETWNRTLEVNLTGYMLSCRRAIPLMAAAGGGTIINTASGSGLLADASRVAYGASKAAIISLTQYIATQHGKDGIRCNAIAPGPVSAPHLREFAGEIFAIIERHMPMRKMGEPQDAAALIAFLASQDSRYINGQVIAIDGGLTAHHAHVVDLAEHMGLAAP